MLPRWLSLLAVLVAVPPIVWTGGGSVTSCHHYQKFDNKWEIDNKDTACSSSTACYWLRADVRQVEPKGDELNALVAGHVAGGCWAPGLLKVHNNHLGDVMSDQKEELEDGKEAKLEIIGGCDDPNQMNRCSEATLKAILPLKKTKTVKRTLPVILCCCDTNDCNSAQPTGYGHRYPAPSPPMERPQLKCEKEPKFCGQPGDEGMCVHKEGESQFVCATEGGEKKDRFGWCVESEENKGDWYPTELFSSTACRYDKELSLRVCCCTGPSCMAADLANLPERTTPTPTTTTVSGGTDAQSPDSVTGGSVAPLCSGGKNTTEATKDDQSSLPLVIVGFALAGVLLLVVVVLVVLLLRCPQKVLALQKPAPETGVPVAAPVGPTATGGPPAATAQVPPPAPAVADKAPETATAEDEPKSTGGGDSESQRSNPLDAHTDSGPGPSCSESSERSKAEGAAVRQPKDGGDQKATPK